LNNIKVLVLIGWDFWTSLFMPCLLTFSVFLTFFDPIALRTCFYRSATLDEILNKETITRNQEETDKYYVPTIKKPFGICSLIIFPVISNLMKSIDASILNSILILLSGILHFHPVLAKLKGKSSIFEFLLIWTSLNFGIFSINLSERIILNTIGIIFWTSLYLAKSRVKETIVWGGFYFFNCLVITKSFSPNFVQNIIQSHFIGLLIYSTFTICLLLSVFNPPKFFILNIYFNTRM
jgi:hypothetical protein